MIMQQDYLTVTTISSMVWAIGHNVKMPYLPNHKFPNPTHYVQVHLKSTTLTFSALTSTVQMQDCLSL